jgi:hypothetical protein
VRGRWAAGIVPRNFNWVIRDSLAVSERPGGYAPNHRRVRRQEEILWLRAQGFDRVVSLLASTHNLHAYDELGVTWSHFPLGGDSDLSEVLSRLYPALAGWIAEGERVLLHQEELGDRVMGVIAGYLRWRGLLPEGARAIAAVEQIVKKQMETGGRSVVALVDNLPPYGTAAADLGSRAGYASADVPATGDRDGRGSADELRPQAGADAGRATGGPAPQHKGSSSEGPPARR